VNPAVAAVRGAQARWQARRGQDGAARELAGRWAAYLETAAEGHVTDSPAVASHVAIRFDRLRSEAESRASSRDLIRKVAEERWT